MRGCNLLKGHRPAGSHGDSDLADSRCTDTRTAGAISEAKWHQYEPCGRDNEREGARLAFGRPVNTSIASTRRT